MLHNATLLQVDPPSGDTLTLRCTLTAPTSSEQSWLDAAGVTASAVVYLPLTGGSLPAIAIDAVLVVRLDGQTPANWVVTHASDRVGGVLRYKQIFVVEQP